MGFSRVLSDWACPPNLPAPAHRPVLPWTNGRTWREWAKASSPGGLQPRLQCGPLPRPRAPAPPRPRAPALQRPGKSRRRKAGGSGTAGWAAAAPIGCAVVPSRAACPLHAPSPLSPPAWELVPAGGRAHRGGTRLPAPHPTPERAGIKPGGGAREPGSGSLRSAERREPGSRSLWLRAPPPLGPGSGSWAPGGRALGGRSAETVLSAEQ